MAKEQGREDADKTRDWSRLLKTRYKKALGEISREYPHKRSLLIDYRDIERFGKEGISLADQLLVNPGAVLEDVEAAVINDRLIRTKDGKELPAGGINIRFTNLPRKPVSAISGPMTLTRLCPLKESCERQPKSGRESLMRLSAARGVILPIRNRNTGSSSSPTGAQRTAAPSRNSS